MRIKLLIASLILIGNLYAQPYHLGGQVKDMDQNPLPYTHIFLPDINQGKTTDENGHFILKNLSPGYHSILISFMGYTTLDTTVLIKKNLDGLIFQLSPSPTTIGEVVVSDNSSQSALYARLKNIDGVAIYAAKKSEIIVPSQSAANLSSNNSRQIFARVPGINVWESDDAGLQLGIGSRGLSPDRTANFNTRQNGYDIAADALGYPESYYAPPMQAIDRIEIVRGAASLQYGTQFGGMINLVLKKGAEDQKISGKTINTYNTLGYFNTFNEIGGQLKKLNYYAFSNVRFGSGARNNSNFNTNTHYLKLAYAVNEKVDISVDFTQMYYLAQQPGGLTDFQFNRDPYQSLRQRNWFEVNWNLASVNLEYKISPNSTLNSRIFGLASSRKALGNLSGSHRLDLQPHAPRDLIIDHYMNIGNETRFLHRYHIGENIAAFLTGIRLYNGNTEKIQGFGSSNSDADFSLIRDELKLKSQFEFPGINIAAFAENVFNFGKRWSVTPGLRYEFIQTGAMGFYDSSVRIPLTGEIVIDSTTSENRERRRSLILAGIGIAYQIDPKLEIYTNFSQNYRAITFNDMRVVNPSAAVDPNLQDERGFNADLGIRGKLLKHFHVDAGLYWLSYHNKIGAIQTTFTDNFFGERIIRYTTNVADAEVLGTEIYLEGNISGLMKMNPVFKLRHFINLAYTRAYYHNSGETAIEGNRLESVPEWNFKTGINAAYLQWKASLQYTFLSSQYSEATNAEISPGGIYGIIPAYSVWDFSLQGNIKNWILEGGVNNILNAAYFTRRATGYPGPGIIPASPRSFYLGLGYSF